MVLSQWTFSSLRPGLNFQYTQAAQQILARAVAQAAVAAAQETQLRELRSRSPPDWEAIGALATQHASSAKTLSHLLGVLRATPRARMVPRGASRRMAHVSRVRPWQETSDGYSKRARQRAPLRRDQRPTGREVIAFIEKFLRIPDGPCAGLENELGFALDWQELPEGQDCRIAITLDADPSAEEDWHRQHDWLAKHLNEMYRAFAPRVRNLEPE
jgi:hypothetical protein